MLKRVINVDGTVIHVLSECQVTTKTKMNQDNFCPVTNTRHFHLCYIVLKVALRAKG